MVKLQPVYSKIQVEKAVIEVARRINVDGFIAPAVIIVVLLGGLYFFKKVTKLIKGEFETDAIRLKSYFGAKTSGSVEIIQDLSNDIAGMDCLVVDDILDSGATSFYLNNLLKNRYPARIRYAYLMVRENAAKYDVVADYKAFTLKGDKFIVGCGMDYNEKYRKLDSICEITV